MRFLTEKQRDVATSLIWEISEGADTPAQARKIIKKLGRLDTFLMKVDDKIEVILDAEG